MKIRVEEYIRPDGSSPYRVWFDGLDAELGNTSNVNVNATMGFEQLAELTDMPSKSLHRMLSPKGNPSMDNLAAIFGAIRKRLKVGIKAYTVDLRKVASRPEVARL